ncbi:enolase C-terminal domain-like protein [Marinivivus vitaminiproducens]|uniref:enolase C-terminal domain-like protein n=1 Tax=Marinivivus vitaminiproducens TaxID=3035935 RepID=UPI00279F0A1C|nr:enolase C-terminal domain-like protein [Geminicoccaceae bacterium SCSIO 64248]
MSAPSLRLIDIGLYERAMPFTHPFRFGAATVREAPQAFVQATVEVEGIGRASGATAEMMMPKWFDKDPAKSPDENIADLRRSLTDARAAYLASRDGDSAFGHHARAIATLAPDPSPPLVRQYGPAVIDKAILDALFRAVGVDAATGLRRNLAGIDSRLTPDLGQAAIDGFLAGIRPGAAIALRWTVGLIDDLDVLARTVEEDGLRYLKIKLGGDVDADLDRLATIARLLDGKTFHATLDANEQYDPDRLVRLAEALQSEARLEGIRRRLLYIEQPFDRRSTPATPLGRAGEAFAFIIDEADDSYDAFPRALEQGYRGVSSKSCKGLYKAILNAARCRASGGGRFMAAEDLTCQAGLAVQQDTALAAMLGCDHVERNGHHYVDGFGPAPRAEAERFRLSHPDLYRDADGIRLDARDGSLRIASLFAGPGLAGGASPDWPSLAGMDVAAPLLERSSS